MISKIKNENENIQDYKIIEKIGQGTFGSVFKVLNSRDNQVYALKQIILKEAKKEELEQLKKEADILSGINNQYIVKYYDSFIEKDTFNIIMEYCEGIDLRKLITEHKNKNKHLDEKEIYIFIYELCLGLKEIHNKNLIHRDLKPENIFLNKNKKIKIGDFGISKVLKNTRYASSKVGTFNYMAPEMIKGEKYNNKIDIWALGCIIYELCTLNRCFDDEAIFPLCNKIINEKHEQIDLNLYSKELQNIIDSLLNKNNKERPDVETIYNLANEYLLTHKSNEIRMIIEIKEDDVNQDIYFLGESYQYKPPFSDTIECVEVLKELNESNTELYINNKKYKYKKYFWFSEKGYYHIKLKFNITIKDCSNMFYYCINLIEIDLSSFDTQNTITMENMFTCCRNLKNLNLSFFNTKKVENMNCMFGGCNELELLDLSSFTTNNVKEMSGMFEACHSLTSLDLSSFNTEKVTSMAKMFDSCSGLKKINVKSFNTKNAFSMDFMFKSCHSLNQIDLSSFEFNNISIWGIFNTLSPLKVILKEKYKNKLINDPSPDFVKNPFIDIICA